MNRTGSLALLASLALCGAVVHAALPREYDLLRERSIFSKERSRRSYSSATRNSPPPSTSPVLVGILQEDIGPAAIFEIPGAGRIAPVRVGEKLPDGSTVTEITLDQVAYTPPESSDVRRVNIGRSLDGSETVLAASTQPTTAEAAIEGEDIVARMKRRRAQELGK